MKYFLILLYVTLLYCKETKNILAFVFPGAKSHNFVFRAVFQHSVQRIKTDNPNLDYKFHILVHNSDKHLWKDTNFEIHGYGDITQYDEKFKQAMENAIADPILGYLEFSRAMIHIYRDFFNDGILGKLKKIKFDLILPDVVNFLTPFLKIELGIEKQMYLNPTCILTWDFDVFEYNAAYNPILGTKFSENMTFFERFINSIYLSGTKAFYKYFAISQVSVFKEYGYDYNLDPFPKDSVFLNQCVNGVHYSLSLPPNIISIGSVLPEESKDIKDKVLNDFLNKHEFNIYISQGTITDKVIRLNTFNELFESFPHVGFVLSLKDEFEKDFKLSENVLRRQWFPQNDLLGHPKLTGFITHGGLNSILESLYHAKPMITIGINIDQVNSAVIVNYRKYGIGITDKSDITISNLKRGVNELISNKEYKENCIQASRYVREQNGREKFYKTLSYVLEYGYDHLLVPAYLESNFIQLYNIDIHITFIVIAYVIYRLFKRLFFK